MIDLEYIPPYYQKYLKWVKDGEIFGLLESNFRKSKEFLNNIPVDKQDYFYAPRKWSVKQIVQHLIDVERIFMYRALRFSRYDATDLHGFDHDDYINVAMIESMAYIDLVKEWESVRMSTLYFYKNLNSKLLRRTGRASGFEFSIESIGYILVGHTRHHTSTIKEKYL